MDDDAPEKAEVRSGLWQPNKSLLDQAVNRLALFLDEATPSLGASGGHDIVGDSKKNEVLLKFVSKSLLSIDSIRLWHVDNIFEHLLQESSKNIVCDGGTKAGDDAVKHIVFGFLIVWKHEENRKERVTKNSHNMAFRISR